MSHDHYETYLIPTSKTRIKSCKCYASYWIKMRQLNIKLVHFDYSIEKAFSHRKYFADQQLLFHFCINCFYEIVNNIPLRVVEFEMLARKNMGCIYKIKHNIMPLGFCCHCCINFVISRFSSCFFYDV